ncbi:MAG: hypothetical protein DMG22_11870, partial [Acidobacteria bacterium]
MAAVAMVLGLEFVGISPPEAWAQTGAGTITGTVREANQAVVPGAQVTVTNMGTNVSAKATTNEVGV